MYSFSGRGIRVMDPKACDFMEQEPDELSFLMDQIDAILRQVREPKGELKGELPEGIHENLAEVRSQIEDLDRRYSQIEKQSGITPSKIFESLKENLSNVAPKDKRNWRRINRLKSEVSCMRDAMKLIVKKKKEPPAGNKGLLPGTPKPKRKKGRGDVGFGRGWKKL